LKNPELLKETRDYPTINSLGGKEEMVMIKHPDGRTEEFKLSKIVAKCEAAGSTPYQTACVLKEVTTDIKDTALVDAEELKDRIVKELEKVNEAAALAYQESERLGP
jgi:hypothetical protein